MRGRSTGRPPRVRSTQLVAEDIAVSLRYATATLTRNTRTDTTRPPADEQDSADEPGPARTTAGGREREFSVVGSD